MPAANRFPDTLVIIAGFIVLFIGLTWLLPAGQFERQEQDGRQVVVPGTYTRVEAQPQSLLRAFTAPIRGFAGAASIIGFVFIVGGAFGMITRTGAIDAGLQRVVAYSQQHPRQRHWVLPLLIALFSLAGATFGMSEEVLVFILISIPLALALGYDRIVGVAVAFVGAGVGFAGAFINPFTVGIAQGIAELPPGSGMGYRLVVWAVMSGVAIAYIMRYARRIERVPSRSLVWALDDSGEAGPSQALAFTAAHRGVLLAFAAALGLLVYGVGRWGWYIEEIAGLFLALGVLSALLGRLGLSAAVAAFKSGAGEMLTAALVIGMAKGLVLIAEDGRIIDTLLHGIASATGGLPKALSVQIMFVLQSALNFFVPSGSGQAALTMPIMAPLSDLLGISRQTSVLAFQFGDGLSNMIIPTSGVTMGVLGIAKIPYPIWLRWMLPLFGWLCLAAALLLWLATWADVWAW